MVVFVDFDETTYDPRTTSSVHMYSNNDDAIALKHRFQQANGFPMNSNEIEKEELERPNPNINTKFSAALGCYPIVVQLAHSLDLNTLHALSLTCRQFRANLLQFRAHLVTQTLRCQNEDGSAPPQELDLRNGLAGSRDIWQVNNGSNLRVLTGRGGTCARDMVQECRRCGAVVCRNCTTKPPPPPHLPSRHRRLCRTCALSPLTTLTLPQNINTNPPAFTAPAFARHPCTCPTHFYLCIPCGATLTSSDTDYRRVWSWRTRYTASLGGLGTGVGEGVEGVKCGRGEHCLGARTVEVESDSGLPPEEYCYNSNSSSSNNSTPQPTLPLPSPSPSPSPSSTHTPSPAHTPNPRAGYLRQEILGIGGVVKKIVKRRVRVGATVREWEDERGDGQKWLERERNGRERSWCGWCERVILRLDEEEGGRGGVGDVK
ncbi:MAG: hypothetical protein M1834_001336 [Cirrosporium novae-zelandiae]|nr:MAG: hypothetical protein M1834_001336 [Cirrosporium novae-zelandiae]